jgi:hypothetical protein
MTQAYNLSQLANRVNSSGQIDASTGLYNGVPSAASLLTTNFTVLQVGAVLMFKYGTTNIASLDASGNLTVIGNVIAYGSV